MIKAQQEVTYKILYGDSSTLEQNVNDKLKEGWELQGGLSAKGHEFIQAIVKRHEPLEVEYYLVTPDTFKECFGNIEDENLINVTMLALKRFIVEDFPLQMAIEMAAKKLNYSSTQDIKNLIIKSAPRHYLEKRAFENERKRDGNDPMYEPSKISY